MCNSIPIKSIRIADDIDRMQHKNHSLRISQTVVDKLTLMAVHAVDDVVDIDGMTVGALIGGVAGGAVGLLQAGPVGSLVGAPMGTAVGAFAGELVDRVKQVHDTHVFYDHGQEVYGMVVKVSAKYKSDLLLLAAETRQRVIAELGSTAGLKLNDITVEIVEIVD